MAMREKTTYAGARSESFVRERVACIDLGKERSEKMVGRRIISYITIYIFYFKKK